MHRKRCTGICSSLFDLFPGRGFQNSNGLKQGRQKDAINSIYNKSHIQQIIVVYKGRRLKELSLFSLC